MTCYEHLRKKQNDDRIKGYLFALENDQTDSYHDAHGRPKKKQNMVEEGSKNEEGKN